MTTAKGITPTFEPARHLTQLGGKDYLEVKFRLVWMRDAHPEARVLTELITHTPEVAVFRCHITLPTGAEATGHGSETPKDFRDYMEKAETKAIGRALAALGFGTQFCGDHDFGAEARGRVVDSPVERPKVQAAHDTRTSQGAGVTAGPKQVLETWVEDAKKTRVVSDPVDPPDPTDDGSITKAQEMQLGGLMKALGMTMPHRQNWLKKHAGSIDYHTFSGAKAARLIKELERRQDEDLQRGLVATTANGQGVL